MDTERRGAGGAFGAAGAGGAAGRGVGRGPLPKNENAGALGAAGSAGSSAAAACFSFSARSAPARGGTRGTI